MVQLLRMPVCECSDCGAYRWRRADREEFEGRGGVMRDGLVEPGDVVKMFVCHACSTGWVVLAGSSRPHVF